MTVNKATAHKPIRGGFSEKAGEYNRYADVQYKTAQKLTENLPSTIPFQSILDIGCGTGNLTELLMKKFPEKRITGIDQAPGMIRYCQKRFEKVSDFTGHHCSLESFIPERNFDLTASNYCLQWIPRKKNALIKIDQMTNRCFTAAIPVSGSFKELYECLDVLGFQDKKLELHDREWWSRIFPTESFKVITQSIVNKTLYYDSPLSALKSFNKIGAVKNREWNENLSFSNITELCRIYQKRAVGGIIPVTYRTLIIQAWKDV